MTANSSTMVFVDMTIKYVINQRFDFFFSGDFPLMEHLKNRKKKFKYFLLLFRGNGFFFFLCVKY